MRRRCAGAAGPLLLVGRPAAAGSSRHASSSSSQRLLLHRLLRPRPISASAADEGPRRGVASRAQPQPHDLDQDLEQQEAADLLKRVVGARHSAKAFDTSRSEVPDRVLADVLAMTLRCPTSFNVQPFTVTIVQSRQGRQKLAACMLGPNQARVLQAPVTAVFAADLDPVKLVPRVQAMERARGLPEAYLSTLPFSVAFLAGQGHLAHAFKDLFTTAMSPLQPMPSVSSLEAWSYKNTAIAASWYMLAAAAHGLDTCPMEGFDGRRIQQVLRIPAPRYAIPLVVATGYATREEKAKAAAASATGNKGRSPRFPPETMVFRESFGQGFKGIPVL